MKKRPWRIHEGMCCIGVGHRRPTEARQGKSVVNVQIAATLAGRRRPYGSVLTDDRVHMRFGRGRLSAAGRERMGVVELCSSAVGGGGVHWRALHGRLLGWHVLIARRQHWHSHAMGLWDNLKRGHREAETPKWARWIATDFDAEPVVLQSRKLKLLEAFHLIYYRTIGE